MRRGLGRCGPCAHSPKRRWHRDILQGVALLAGTGDTPDMCPVHAPIYVSKYWALLRRHKTKLRGNSVSYQQMMLWQQVYVKTQAIKHFTLAMLQCCDNMLPTTATGNVTIAASNRWATLCKCLRITPFFIAVHNQAWWETQEETVR